MLTSRTESNYGKIDISRSGVVPATAPTTWATGAIAFWIDKNAPSSDGKVLGFASRSNQLQRQARLRHPAADQLLLSVHRPLIVPWNVTLVAKFWQA